MKELFDQQTLIITLLVALIVLLAFLTCRRCCKCPNSSWHRTDFKQNNIAIFNTTYPYTLPALTFAYDALEPHLDAETMQIHHTKHHQTYVDTLNKALEAFPDLHRLTLETLLTNLDWLPASIRTIVRNHGGGHFAHALYWHTMSPQGGGQPTAPILKEIEKNFGSFQAFQEQFEKAAKEQFGSGWAWLCVTPDKTLKLIATTNHGTPLEQGLFPILVVDVWEHAYYLKFRNKRADFVKTWWNVVDWKNVETLLSTAKNTSF